MQDADRDGPAFLFKVNRISVLHSTRANLTRQNGKKVSSQQDSFKKMSQSTPSVNACLKNV